MSKVVNPFSYRLGILNDWRNRWFAKNADYRSNLKADILLREYLVKELRGMYIDSIDIERNKNTIRVIVRTARPGMLIGRNGEGSVALRDKIAKFLTRKGLPVPELKLDIEEIRVPEASAAVVAYMVVESLEKRMAFRRVLKTTVEKVMSNRDVQGVRISLGGMLGGGSMSRTEEIKRGRVPLQTLRSNIDYARERANLPLGVIGVKVWIYKGEVFAKDKDK